MARRRLYRLSKMEDRFWSGNGWGGFNMGGGAHIISGTDPDGSTWSVVDMNSSGSYVEDRITFDYPLSEIKFARQIGDFEGKMDLLIDGASVITIPGPAAWEFSPALKVLSGRHDIEITAYGGSKAQLGDIKIFSYDEINCLFRKPVPFRQELSPTSHDILRGFSVFQQTKRGHATSKFSLYFNDANSYLDFMANSYKVHAIKDELGIFYRGVILVEDVTMISEECFYVDCVFNAPYQAGVGW